MLFPPPPPKFCPAVRIHDGGFRSPLRHITIELFLLKNTLKGFEKREKLIYFKIYFEFSVFIVLLVSILGGQDELVGG